MGLVMVESLFAIVAKYLAYNVLGFGAKDYYNRYRKGDRPFPDKPIREDQDYVMNQKKMMDLYKKDLETRINDDKIF